MKYLAIFEKSKTGWGAYVPDLPGCIATGKTWKQVESRIHSAINVHLEAMRADGDKIPEPSPFLEVEVGIVNLSR